MITMKILEENQKRIECTWQEEETHHPSVSSCFVRAITRVVRHSCQLGGGNVVEASGKAAVSTFTLFPSLSLPPSVAGSR